MAEDTEDQGSWWQGKITDTTPPHLPRLQCWHWLLYQLQRVHVPLLHDVPCFASHERGCSRRDGWL